MRFYFLFIDDNLFIDYSDDFWEQRLTFISRNRISLHSYAILGELRITICIIWVIFFPIYKCSYTLSRYLLYDTP